MHYKARNTHGMTTTSNWFLDLFVYYIREALSTTHSDAHHCHTGHNFALGNNSLMSRGTCNLHIVLL